MGCWDWKKSAWKSVKKMLVVVGSAALVALADPVAVKEILAAGAAPAAVITTGTTVITGIATFLLDALKHR